MTIKIHNLLKRQIKKHFSTKEMPPALRPFIDAVNEAYLQSDDDRNMLERSLELSSDELLQANSELRAIIQALPDLFFTIDTTGEILDIKAGNTNDLVLQPSRLIGRRIYDVSHAKVGAQFAEAIQQLEQGARLVTIEYSLQLAGKENVFETRLLPLREKQILAVVRNITDAKQAQQALKDSEARYRRVLEASPDPIIVYDRQGRATYINQAFSNTFGWSIDEVFMQKVPYIPEGCKADTQTIIDAVTRGKVRYAAETRRTTKAGRVLDVSISAAVWQDAAGEPAGSVVTIRDITEKKALEAALIQAHKMEAIGILAGGLAHDFNNLLMGMQGTTSLMLSEIDHRHPFFEKLESIESYVKSGADLTRQLLGFAQGGKYEIKPLDVNAIIRQSAEMFGRTRKQIRIDLDLAENLWTVAADASQIEQVLLNLHVNAWQAMPEGGRLSVGTRNIILDEDGVSQGKLTRRRNIRITVTDTGAGIDESIQEKIFDPFFTTKEIGQGTGLGLASAYGIVKNHGGGIEVRSARQCGTAFTIFLPASGKKVPVTERLPDRILTGSGTVLLIDDEKLIRDIGREMLESLGYHVLATASGEEGCRIYQNSPPIDLVILDMIMPQWSGGMTFDRLKQIDPQARVLLSSGYSIDGEAAAILERGCNGFIQKPFSLKQLSHKIREVLGNEP